MMDQRVMQAHLAQIRSSYVARTQLIRQIEDTELAQMLWDYQRGNYLTRLRQWHPRLSGFRAFEYTQPRLLHLHDYSDMVEMTEAYLASLNVVNSRDLTLCANEAGKLGFVFNQGFEFPFRYRLAYRHMTLSNGDTWQIPAVADEQKPSGPIVRQGDVYCYQQPAMANAPQPVSVSAEFRGQLPDDVLKLTFTAADIGKTVEKGGYLVTLQAFGQNYYTVVVSAADDKRRNIDQVDLLAEATDRHGEYIADALIERRPSIREQKLEVLLGDLIACGIQGTLDKATAEHELQALDNRMLAEEEGKLYLFRGFFGVIDKAELTLLVYNDDNRGVVRELALPVYNFANVPAAGDATMDERLQALPEMAVTAPIYDDRAELRTTLVELDAAKLEERIETLQLLRATTNAQMIAPAENDAAEKQYPAEVSWFFPPVQSDLFFPRRMRSGLFVLTKLDFYDKDDKLVKDPTLGIDPKLIDYQNDIFGFEVRAGIAALPFMVGRVQYRPEIFLRRPARLKGVLPIAVLLNPLIDRFAPEALPAGITLVGNRLVVDYSVFEPREMADDIDETVERQHVVLVRDNHGYLAEIKQETWYHQDAEHKAVDIYYFYGKPETVEIWYRGKREYVDYKFDIQLLNEDVER
ncbi:hypothetical protein [Alkalimonas mucilaginosa]|uniref:Uncharacterized protein n=1 Tax=Alkalimonas mucilaginosa TaxID=3057676 RepID=A0ABU7JIY5_9GAMM|nr:hypothetical protein [Alkalimonas sp. MEB004]MEE2025386.1 hypothetical protein [Alkalimonas sp. MEB004]